MSLFVVSLVTSCDDNQTLSPQDADAGDAADGATADAADTADTVDANDTSADGPDTGDAGADVADTQIDTDPGDTADTAEEPGEIEPPAFESIRGELAGPVTTILDLADDQRVIIPDPALASLRVFVSDNVTAAADMVVEVLVGENMVEPSSQTFSGGLWRISLSVEPGSEVRLRIRDEAGNETTSPTLILPGQAEAIVDNWEIRYFADDQSLDHTWESEFGAGVWSETQEESGLEHAGTWELTEEGRLSISETTHSSEADSDDDAETVEWARTYDLYVDETYFAVEPYGRVEGGDGLLGVWERDVSEYGPSEAGPVLIEERHEVLTLEEGGAFTELLSGTTFDGDTEEPYEVTLTGTWEVELNENYTDSYGDFLVRTVEMVGEDNCDIQCDFFELYVVRADRLMLEPRLRAP